MKTFRIPYEDTQKFSRLVIDYLSEDRRLKSFINHFPEIDNFEKQITAKQNHPINRKVLVEVLRQQNTDLNLSKKSEKNIDNLLNKDAFTITTGHQLCLFTGPLYFLYKIISALNLAEQLQEKFPEKNIVPVFWMTTEDHDFKEINHIHLFGKEIVWDNLQSGAVGRMNLSEFESVLHELKLVLGESENAEKLLNIFENAYLKHQNLAQATRYLVNELFGKYGLVILDGDDKILKKQFIPIIKKDVLQQGFVKTIKQCSDQLAKDYKAQAFVRGINFFTLAEGGRELIKGGITEKEIDKSPDKFSPNVLLRPLYQETILPNIATIGGGAEAAYWMQLKTAFEQENIPFPILVLRNSVLLLSDKQNEKLIDLGFGIDDIFKQEHALQKQYVFSQKSTEISLKKQQEAMEKVFAELLEKTNDIAMQNSIKAQLHKQLSALDKLEEKLIRNEKKKHETALQQISKIKNQLFPNNILQERYANFIPFYLKYGDNFIEILKENLNPLNPNFVVLIL